MTTSGTTSYQATRDTIIQGALRLVGAIGQGDSPTTSQVSEASEALNLMVKAWMAQGMPVWAITETTFPIVAGTNSYTIGTSQTINTSKPLKIIQAWNQTLAGTIDTPMRIISKNEYNMLGNKSTQGNPIQLMYEPQLMTGTIHLFPTPDSASATANQIHIVYQRLFEDFNTSTDTPDFPQEWHDALKWGLAARIAKEYGMPPNDYRDLTSTAQKIYDEAISIGTEEGSIYFARDWRGY